MAGLRFAELQSRPMEFLDFTSVTLDEFQQLVPPFEAAFQASMATWRMDGKPRTARRFTVYKNCPLPTPEDRLFFILTYLKTYALQVVQGRLFGSSRHRRYGLLKCSPADQCLFGPFCLGVSRRIPACWRDAEAIPLPPKAFDVLHYLVTHPDRLVTKDELSDAVWPATAVSAAVVRVAIGTLRQALGETAQTPRYLATVPRRGYRFLAPVTMLTPAASPSALPPPPSPHPPLLVERDAVLAQLHACLARAQQGTRQVVLVTGESGIGKTAVVEAFVAQAARQERWEVAQGQCVEAYGVHEAYQPVLEALELLCQAPQGARLVALLRQHAPTWLVQLPWLLTEADRARSQHELHGATRERMLRECAELVDALTAETPLLLVLEDLHWSDYATLDLLAALARRTPRHGSSLFGTYRPGEALAQDHPLQTVTQDLRGAGMMRPRWRC